MIDYMQNVDLKAKLTTSTSAYCWRISDEEMNIKAMIAYNSEMERYNFASLNNPVITYHQLKSKKLIKMSK